MTSLYTKVRDSPAYFTSNVIKLISNSFNNSITKSIQPGGLIYNTILSLIGDNPLSTQEFVALNFSTQTIGDSTTNNNIVYFDTHTSSSFLTVTSILSESSRQVTQFTILTSGTYYFSFTVKSFSTQDFEIIFGLSNNNNSNILTITKTTGGTSNLTNYGYINLSQGDILNLVNLSIDGDEEPTDITLTSLSSIPNISLTLKLVSTAI